MDLLLQLTTYSVILSWIVFSFGKIFQVPVPCVLITLVQGIAFFVATGVLCVYVTYGHETVLQFYVRKQGFTALPTWTLLIIDWFCHFLPVFLVGFPTHSMTFFLGYLVTIVWYATVREKMFRLYPLDGVDFDRIMLTIACVCYVCVLITSNISS